MIEVVKYRDLLPISSIPRFVEDVGALTLEIKGEDFTAIETVLINDIRVPSFIVVNRNTLWAELPEGAKAGITKVEAISSRFTKNNPFSACTYEFGTKTKTVSGLLRLSQLFIKWLLQSPGSDIFNPDRGGGVQNLVGQLSTSKKMDGIMAAITRAATTTANQIRTAQTNESRLTADEKLLSAEVTDINVYEEQMEAHVKINLVSVSGRDAITSLSL